MIEFSVISEPRPKQSFRVSGHGRGFTPARVKAWQTDVAIEAERAMRDIGRFNNPFSGELSAKIEFMLGNHRRVDLDNLNKAVFDGLNRIVFEDDQQVCELHLRKIVSKDTPGVRVCVGNEVEINHSLFIELIHMLPREFVLDTLEAEGLFKQSIDRKVAVMGMDA